MLSQEQPFTFSPSGDISYLLPPSVDIRQLARGLCKILPFLVAASILIYRTTGPLSSLPAPKQPPFWRRLLKEPTPWLFEKWMKEIPNDGIIRYYGIFNQERLLMTSSTAVRDVLVTNPYHFHKQRAQKLHLEPVSGKGLVLVEGETHRHHRKQMNPAFAIKNVRDCQKIFWKKTLEIVNSFQHQINPHSYTAGADKGATSGVVEVHDPVSRAVLDVIGLAGFSLDFESLSEDGSHRQMVQEYRKAFGVSSSNRIRCLLAYVLPAWIVNLIPIERNKILASVTKMLEGLTYEILNAKRSNIKGSSPDIFDKIMERGGLPDEVLADQIKTLLAGGHDTTSSTIASVAAVLSQPRYHHVQDKMRAEIREKLPSLSSPMLASATDIEALPYVNAVRNEILRLYPPFSWYFRKSVVDTTICGHRVPKTTNITLCPWGLHRSTELWGPDAEEFNPDRWLKDPSGRGGAKDAYSFNTFSAGPRVCIAERFARNEISTLMAGIFGRFRVEKAEGIKEAPLSHQLVLTRIGGVHVRMTPLEGW